MDRTSVRGARAPARPGRARRPQARPAVAPAPPRRPGSPALAARIVEELLAVRLPGGAAGGLTGEIRSVGPARPDHQLEVFLHAQFIIPLLVHAPSPGHRVTAPGGVWAPAIRRAGRPRRDRVP